METEEEPSAPSRRTRTILLAAAWMCLGAWALDGGRTALGVGQVLLGLVFLVTALGPQADAGLFRRRGR